MLKYEVIVDEIKEKIVTGKLPQGEKLPSIRSLAERYDCNKDTVIKALANLKNEGLIYSLAKSGYYVLKNTPDREINFANSDINLSSAFPLADFRHCVNQAVLENEQYLYSDYQEQRGLKELINSFYNLLASYGLYADKKQIVITSGIQQALYILLQIIDVSQGKRQNKLIIEQPTYHRMNNLVKRLGIVYTTIERTTSGIDFSVLERLFASGEYKYFYTIPRFHTPLGVSYSELQKQKIAALAKRYDVYVIEDDFMADFSVKNSSPIHYYDTAGKVIYLKSFSPIIFSALRVGAVILPLKLLEPFMDYRQMIDYDVNFILQKALSLYIDNGLLEKHRQHLIAEKQKRIAEIANLFKQYKIDVLYYDDKKMVGMLAKGVKAYQLSSDLAIRELDFFEDSYIDYCPYKYFQIQYSQYDKQELDNLFKILAKSLKISDK